MNRTLALLLALAVAATGAAPAAADTVTSTLGDVSAELTWEPGLPSETAPSLKIARAGQGFTFAPARCTAGEDGKVFCEQPGVLERSKPVQVVDLDADGEPEVVVDLYTGGAHCCVVTRIYRWDAAATRYESLRTDWADTGYRLDDVERDGKVEFLTADPRFGYAFSSFAESAFPVQVYAYADGELDDVSAAYPKLIRRDARSLWRSYRNERSERDVRGVLAAYVADKVRLGEGAEAWRRLRGALRRGDLDSRFGGPTGRRYLRVLRRSLRSWGYVASL